MSSLKQLHLIDDRTKFTVYGWIRNISKIYGWSNFPLAEIASISIFYFHHTEVFKNIDPSMKLSDDKLTVTKISRNGDWNNASYGSTKVASTTDIICEWKLSFFKQNFFNFFR